MDFNELRLALLQVLVHVSNDLIVHELIGDGNIHKEAGNVGAFLELSKLGEDVVQDGVNDVAITTNQCALVLFAVVEAKARASHRATHTDTHPRKVRSHTSDLRVRGTRFESHEQHVHIRALWHIELDNAEEVEQPRRCRLWLLVPQIHFVLVVQLSKHIVQQLHQFHADLLVKHHQGEPSHVEWLPLELLHDELD